MLFRSVLATVIQGSLPPLVREHYDIPWSVGDTLRWHGITRALRIANTAPVLRETKLLRGRSDSFYQAVQRSERALVARGGVSMPGVSEHPAPTVRTHV